MPQSVNRPLMKGCLLCCWLALALMPAWGYGAWALGELRAKVVFK